MSREIFKRHCRAFLLGCIVLLFISLLSASVVVSQTSATGALTGTLKDASGAVVPNATVTATNNGTGQVRTTATDSDGSYKFELLFPGDYKLRFEASGFTTSEAPSVTVVVTETAVLNQALQVGAQTQQVEVRSEAETIQTASSTLGTVVNAQAITSLPLTSRNYTTLLGIAAGANTGVYNAANIGAGSQNIAVNGSGTAQNNFQMDGASINNFNSNGNTAGTGAAAGIGIVNPDAIEEFKIQTSLYDAGYGRNPGANVNVVTKSGANQFHGTAFEFFRNTALNANDFFRKMSPAVSGVANNGRQVLNQNQYGGSMGGPIKRSKLLFFASYQETQQKNGISPAGYSAPTLIGIPQGDRSNTAAFRTALGAAFCPGGSATIGQGSSVNGPAAGGTKVACSGANINPVAINILQLKNPNGNYFVPSSSNGLNQNTTFSIPATYAEHQAVGNLDYLINSNNTLSTRWFISEATTNASMGCTATSASVSQCLPGGSGILHYPTQYGVAKLTSILSNNVVNEVRVSLQAILVNFQNQIPFTDTQVGIAPIVPETNYLDTITVTGLMQWGGIAQLTTNRRFVGWEAADQISWSHGKHTIRAGFEYERDRINWLFPGAAIGNLTFQSFQDFLLGLPGCAPSVSQAACTSSGLTGQTNGSFSSNVSNTGTTVALTPPGGIRHNFRAPAANVFVQDDYKVSNNLTLNLGLRWEYDGVIYDASGELTNVWPALINTVPAPGTSAATGTLAGFVVPSNFNFGANPAPPVGGLFQNVHKIITENNPSLKNFAPRLGFAWKPLASDRFVVRGGGGYFYDRPGMTNYNRVAQGQPYAQTISASGSANYFSNLAQPYAQTALGWSPRWANATTSSNLNAFAVDPISITPLTYEWNLNVQYEFLPRWVVEVGYVGSRGIHQIPDAFNSLDREINEAQLASAANPINGINTNTVTNAPLRVPYLGFAPAGLQMFQAWGDTKFNSLQAVVRKQFSHGLQMQAAYTFSRSFSTGIYNGYNDPLHPQYGLDAGYRPQRLTVNYTYDLPFGRHEGLLGKVASGWNLAGVTVVQDGTPVTVTDTRGGSVYGFGAGSPVNSTAEFVAGMGSANVATPGGVEARLGGATGGPGYLNKAAFVSTGPPVIGSDGKATGYGNTGLGILLGPGQFNFDATLQKTTKVGGIHEDATLVFRTELFNVFNHAQFNNPAVVDVSKSTFGQITTTSVNPRLIQFALKYVF
jgi:Carboxypeptidase regulatory-like domain/TonB-dependent Receptor Plug Domain